MRIYMNKLLERHIELVEKVNHATTKSDEINAANVLYGFREALSVLGIKQLIECDLYYIDKGVDRPMCCGVFLDKSYNEQGKRTGAAYGE